MLLTSRVSDSVKMVNPDIVIPTVSIIDDTNSHTSERYVFRFISLMVY